MRQVFLGLLLAVGAVAIAFGADTAPVRAQAVGFDAAASLCGKRAPCRPVWRSGAGNDAQGRPMTVVELGLRSRPKGKGKAAAKCRPYQREYWLMTGKEGVDGRKRIMGMCNDGYGAADVGDDEVDLEVNELLHRRIGGSNWRWEITRNVTLDPLEVTKSSSCTYNAATPGFVLQNWDWKSFQGTAQWAPRQCNAPDKVEPNWCDASAATKRYLPIPQLADGNKQAGTGAPHLDGCGSTLQFGGGRGFSISGDASPIFSGNVRMLMTSPRDLLLTVVADAIQSGSSDWKKDDHLQIWTGDVVHARCGGPRNRVRAWAVRIADGAVFPITGGKGPSIKVTAKDNGALNGRKAWSFRIRLPRDAAGLTVAYSVSNGSRTVGTVATSPLNPAKPDSLGGVFRLPAGSVQCRVAGKALRLVKSGDVSLLDE